MVLLTAQFCMPSAVTILRGNHETYGLNQDFGFLQEIMVKYDQDVFLKFQDLFRSLPVAAVIENAVFVVHGGLGPRIAQATIEQINKEVNRKVVDIELHEFDSILSEMLWSDPKEGIKGIKSSPRGIAYYYGNDITETFLRTNNLKLVVRSHEAEQNGYKVLHGGKCMTIFSAPNYCGSQRNKGAILRFPPEAQLDSPQIEYEIRQFSEEPNSFRSSVMQFEKLRRLKISAK